MNVLVVHAHHEPKSFCSALCRQAESALREHGHEVVMSDLHAIGFDPVSDRRNFTTVKNPDYLKQQAEELYASQSGGFAEDVETEMKKLEACDAIIFSFPLWWFGMPAILKGWCDRVLAMGRVYGGSQLYEGGVGQATKRALVVMTTGGGPLAYDGWGLNPSLQSILIPIQHGVFWFNGFLPLEPFIAWSPGRIDDSQREAYLQSLAARMHALFQERPLQLPRMADFPNWSHDRLQRFLVVARYRHGPDEQYARRVLDQTERIEQLKRDGVILDFNTTAPTDPNWRAFLSMRAADEAEVRRTLSELPLADELDFEVSTLSPPPQRGERPPGEQR